MGAAAEILGRIAARQAVDAPVAVVCAHPDDETIGAGAVLRLFRHLLLVHVTDGAPRNMQDARRYGFATAEAYAAARRMELADAMRAGGVEAEMAALGVPDQQASFQLLEIAARLRQLLEARGIAAVMTHAYEGGHPDHDAIAFAVHAATAVMVPPPAILEMALYHAAPDGMTECCFLPGGPEAMQLMLAPAEQDRKRAMIAAFRTQAETLARFGVEREAFRAAPAYDFSAPPHPGALHYEHYDWGMTGGRWRELARDALAAMR